jgi:hypothetical protein
MAPKVLQIPVFQERKKRQKGLATTFMWYGMAQNRAATDVRGPKNRTVQIISLKKMLTFNSIQV